MHEAGRFFKWIKEVLHTVSETVVAKLSIDLTNNPFTVGSFWAYSRLQGGFSILLTTTKDSATPCGLFATDS